jgi:hypothetical protein
MFPICDISSFYHYHCCRVTQVVNYLPNNHEFLSSELSTTKIQIDHYTHFHWVHLHCSIYCCAWFLCYLDEGWIFWPSDFMLITGFGNLFNLPSFFPNFSTPLGEISFRYFCSQIFYFILKQYCVQICSFNSRWMLFSEHITCPPWL